MITRKVSLYEDKIILGFEESRHIYTILKSDLPEIKVGSKVPSVPSVTGVLGVINKPALIAWASNVAIDSVTGAMIAPGFSLDRAAINHKQSKCTADCFLCAAKRAHTQIKNEAAEIGKAAHAWIAHYIQSSISKKKAPALPEEEPIQKCCNGFLNWLEDYKVKFLASEQMVFSRDFFYAGTFDLDAEVDGKREFIDFKTGKALYKESILQLTAYAWAKQEETGEYVRRSLLRLDKEESGKHEYIRIDKDGNNPKARKRDLQGFFACLDLYEWQKNTEL